MNHERWSRIVSSLDYAFQPIVSIHTGICLGYEALHNPTRGQLHT